MLLLSSTEVYVQFFARSTFYVQQKMVYTHVKEERIKLKNFNMTECNKMLNPTFLLFRRERQIKSKHKHSDIQCLIKIRSLQYYYHNLF